MRQICIAGILILFVAGCGPVNLFTRVKHIPREYSENYGTDNVLARRSEINRQPWIVWSERGDNPSFQRPGGKVVVKKHDFATPFAVIGKKRNYLKLVAWTPDLLDNGKIADRKKAEYCGWMDKNKLLATASGLTDILTDCKRGSLTAITDTCALFQPETFCRPDSAMVYAGPDLSVQHGMIALHSMVYRMKKSDDAGKWLIASVPLIGPEGKEILGWIDGRMLKETSRELYIETDEAEDLPALLSPAPMIAPVLDDSIIRFTTLKPLPVIDPTDNCIYNVDGNKITWNDRRRYERQLRRIDVVFAFEPGNNLEERFPTLVNAVQNMSAFFEDSHFLYRFIAAVPDSKGSLVIIETSTLNELADWLMQHPPVAREAGRDWQTLRHVLRLLPHSEATPRLIVSIGDRLKGGETADSALMKRMSDVNGCFLGFQYRAAAGDSYNNYVLQAASLIQGYAGIIARKKRQYTVFTDQIRRENQFSENNRNSYMLDYPGRSVTQGLIVFPETGGELPDDLLVSSVDTLLKQIKDNSRMLTGSFERAFRTAGNSKDRYDASLASYWNISPQRKIDTAYRTVFAGSYPLWIKDSDTLTAAYTQSTCGKFFLLAGEEETAEIKEFVEGLSKQEVDTKDENKVKQRKRTVKSVRKEMRRRGLYSWPSEVVIPTPDTLSSIGYASTRKVRKHLYRHYRKIAGRGPIPLSGKKLKTTSLADIQAHITRLPSVTPALENIQLKDIKKKKILKDTELDDLVRYFKTCKTRFGSALSPANTLQAGTMKYYRIPMNTLP